MSHSASALCSLIFSLALGIEKCVTTGSALLPSLALCPCFSTCMENPTANFYLGLSSCNQCKLRGICYFSSVLLGNKEMVHKFEINLNSVLQNKMKYELSLTK